MFDRSKVNRYHRASNTVISILARSNQPMEVDPSSTAVLFPHRDHAALIYRHPTLQKRRKSCMIPIVTRFQVKRFERECRSPLLYWARAPFRSTHPTITRRLPGTSPPFDAARNA
nr:hypothetical protein [Candidatus Sigynarchaeota archaeon]